MYIHIHYTIHHICYNPCICIHILVIYPARSVVLSTQEGDWFFLVLELMRGGSGLDELLRGGFPLDEHVKIR